jgi:hypothetical protein
MEFVGVKNSNLLVAKRVSPKLLSEMEVPDLANMAEDEVSWYLHKRHVPSCEMLVSEKVLPFTDSSEGNVSFNVIGQDSKVWMELSPRKSVQRVESMDCFEVDIASFPTNFSIYVGRGGYVVLNPIRFICDSLDELIAMSGYRYNTCFYVKVVDGYKAYLVNRIDR